MRGARHVAAACVLLCAAATAFAQQPTRGEVEELKKLLEQQEQSIRALKARIDQLEGRSAPAATAPVAKPGEVPSPAEQAEALAFPAARESPVEDRGNFDDRQEAAPRPGDFVLDPQYRGFIPIPRTVFMVKFNPKPRLDLMFNNRNPGAPYRFVPALMITEGQPGFGGGEQFNATANGSQLRVDMRAPSLPGDFRFYYQNDFFGSDQKQMQYRLQHLYGQFYGVVAGFTYGVFEDPDSWPDTVDYEGPNALIFARRPLVHYIAELADDWSVTVGLEDPSLYIDTTGDTGGTVQPRAPDGGFNVRWTPGSLGHLQFSTILRSLNVSGGSFGTASTIGWGVNLAGSINLTSNDSMQFLGVYGEGVGGMGNDTSFVNSDAAFNSRGDLIALPYASGMLAFSHRWTPRWRSTATFGYVSLDNTSQQAGSAYHTSRYGSLNLMYQVLKRLSVGVEGLYGFREVKSGATTKDVIRIDVGMVYSLFD